MIALAWITMALAGPGEVLDAAWETSRSDVTWRSPVVSEREAVREAMRALAAAPDPCEAVPEARRLLEPVDMVVDLLEGEPRLVVVREGREHRGSGFFVVRCGPARPWVWQAPHAFFEAPTRIIARQLFLESQARATLWNTVHRYRSLPGESPAHEVHPGDVTREYGSLFQAATIGLAAGDPSLGFVQLHGFTREALPWDAVVSFGAAESYAGDLAEALEPVLGRVAAWGRDVDVLGGTTNVQGRALSRAGRRFLHLELASETRRLLVEDPARRAALAAVLEDAW
ncbi:MAG: hypothetical protein JXB39_00195 [Deltaproteobacteria bacterium]|nr:hypothetical protein [Deltaproteobacteria bacterium]